MKIFDSRIGIAALILTTAAQLHAGEKSADLAPLVKLLATIDDADFQLDVLGGIYDAVKGRRSVKMPAGWKDVSARLARSDSDTVRRQALLLSLIFGDDKAARMLRQRVADADASKASRTEALQALVQARTPGLGAFLQSLLDDDVMRRGSLRAMASLDGKSVPSVILERYPSFSTEEKQDAVSTLTARVPFAMALLDAVGEGDVPSRDISAYAARQMMALGDRQIDKRLKKVWGNVRPTTGDRAALIAEFKQRLTPDVLKKGNASRGRAVFQRTCASCHKLFDAGKSIGPELTGSQRRNLDYVLTNLLDPNAVIGRDYRMTLVVTDVGRVVTGIVRAENAQTLSLQTANDLVLIPKAEIEVRKQSPVSLMPDGMLQKMSPDEVRDLVKYLAADEQAALPAD